MRKTLSFLLCCALLFVSCVGLFGCTIDKTYRGEYKELYTVAVYSIPCAAGYMSHGEGTYSSQIYIWEQDDYGRILFSYCEDNSDNGFALVVSQAYDEANVYFYPDINFELTYIESKSSYNMVDEDYLKKKTENFYLEKKDQLKEANDWNQPIDKSKCVSYPITNQKTKFENAYILSSDDCEKILNEYIKQFNLPYLPYEKESPIKGNGSIQVDAEGKTLHSIFAVHTRVDRLSGWKQDFKHYTIKLWVITDQYGNYDKEKGILVMYSEIDGEGLDKDNVNWSYRHNAQEIFEFKKQNNWVYSYCTNGN